MTSGDRSERALFALEPRGADLSPGMIGTLAQGGGILVGAIVNGLVRTSLADTDGSLAAVARCDSLVAISSQRTPVR
jgi:hypothetical protein